MNRFDATFLAGIHCFCNLFAFDTFFPGDIWGPLPAVFVLPQCWFCFLYYRTRVRSLGMLVTNSLPNSLTDCCLVNLIDVTLACEDTNSKFVDIVTVANVDDEDRVGNSLLQIW